MRNPPVGLYVHLPWCVAKCPYCDFNSHKAPDQLPGNAYIAALLDDMDAEARGLPGSGPGQLTSVFFGGGTPSLFSPDQLGLVIERADQLWGLVPGCEVTMEANPGTVEHAPWDGYLDAGINRLSIGVQSFDDSSLKRLGRIHQANDARQAMDRAREAGFKRINVDLMYGLPHQTIEAAVGDVKIALDAGISHLSHYQLTLEPNTMFAARPPAGLPDEDLTADMQAACVSEISAAGLAHYEVSGYAVPGEECRHNLNYWRYGDYLGIGAGAHGKFVHEGEAWRTVKKRHPTDYQRSSSKVLSTTRLDTSTRLFEFALNAFRLTEGFRIQQFESATGCEFDSETGPFAQAMGKNLIEIDGDRIRPTDLGQRFLNDLTGMFLPAENTPAEPGRTSVPELRRT